LLFHSITVFIDDQQSWTQLVMAQYGFLSLLAPGGLQLQHSPRHFFEDRPELLANGWTGTYGWPKSPFSKDNPVQSGCKNSFMNAQ
jgi:hypothetical protein